MKKLLALMVSVAMVFSMCTSVFAYSDVEEGTYVSEAVTILSELNVFNGYADGTFKPEQAVTRAEMAALIARIQGYGETAKTGAYTKFIDVPVTHWASGYVANATNMGIINGHGDGTFEPEAPVLYEQAIKMIMATLGYTPFAEKNGGYPTGYLAAAQRADILSTVSGATVGQIANRGVIAQLLANAIETPLMIQSKWNSSGEVEYEITEDKTLLTENLGYKKIEGVVTETSFTDGAFDLTDDITVTIAGEDYIVGNTNAAEYYGYNVVAYADKEDCLISATIDVDKNDTLIVSFDNLVIDEEIIKYYKKNSDKAIEISLADDFEFIYNGVMATDFINKIENVDNNEGQVTFINSSEGKKYNYAIVEAISTEIVDEVEDNAILCKSGNTYVIDVEDTDKLITIVKDGKEIKPYALNEYDILSVTADEGNNIVNIEVITDTVVGTVTSTKSSTIIDGQLSYKINGVWYEVAKSVEDCEDAIALSVGGTFYLNKYGKIAAFVEDAALATGIAKNIGYIFNTALVDDSSTFNKKVLKVQMLTKSGVEIFTVKDNAKIVVDSKSVTDNGIPTEKVVEYFKNSADQITSIKEIVFDDFEEDSYVFNTEDFEFEGMGTDFNTKTTVFYVDEKDVENSTIGLLTALEDQNTYLVKAIAEDDNIIVIDAKGLNAAGATTNLAIITDLSTTINKDDEEVYMISYFIDGKKVEDVITTNEIKESEVQIGNVVKIKVINDVIVDVKPVFTYNNDTYEIKGEDQGDEEFFGGQVDEYKKTSNKATINGEEYRIGQANNTYVVDVDALGNVVITRGSYKYFSKIYDTTEDTVKVKTNDDEGYKDKSISEAKEMADKVYGRKYDGKVVDVIILRGSIISAISASTK